MAVVKLKDRGYQVLRNCIQGVQGESFSHIGLKNASGAEVARFQISGAGSKCTWTHQTGTQVMQLKVVLKGSDLVTAGATLPQYLHSGAIYSGGVVGVDNALTEDALLMAMNNPNLQVDALLGDIDDEIEQVIYIQVPEVV